SGSDRLEKVIGTFEDLVQNGSVAPDLGIERGTACVENSYDLPMSPSEIHGTTDGERYRPFAVVRADNQSAIGSRGVLANDQLGKSRLNHTAFCDFDRSANLENVGRNSPDLSIGVSAIRDQRERHDAHDFLGNQRSAMRVQRHTWSVFDDFH